MKVVIQIPCYNEEQSLGVTIACLPRALPGIGKVEWLVIDDGSQDGTARKAQELGVDHIIRLKRNRGLAFAFMAGLQASVAAGADIIVHLDADNQYNADDIPKLIAPILAGEAELVIGSRQFPSINVKNLLQKLGSWVVRMASNTSVPDATSGFRAMSRATALRLKVFSDYSFALETIIQAGQKGIALASVPIRTNPYLRPSRLMSSIPDYVGRSTLTIIRIFMAYRPFAFFTIPGAASVLAGLALGVRFLFYYLTASGGRTAGHVQSVILSALLLGIGFFLVVIGLIADLISVNRKLLEQVDWKLEVLERGPIES